MWRSGTQRNDEDFADILGTLYFPNFFAITTGRNLLFHAKIGENTHVYRINTVNQHTVNLVCCVANCRAKAKMAIKPEFVEITPGGKRRKNGNLRATFKIKDLTDEGLLQLENWRTMAHPTDPHTICLQDPKTRRKKYTRKPKVLEIQGNPEIEENSEAQFHESNENFEPEQDTFDESVSCDVEEDEEVFRL